MDKIDNRQMQNIKNQMRNLERNTGFKFCLDNDSHAIFMDDDGNSVTIESIIIDWHENDI